MKRAHTLKLIINKVLLLGDRAMRYLIKKNSKEKEGGQGKRGRKEERVKEKRGKDNI